MLTKGQKIYMYISAILGMLIGIFVLVPFRTLPGLFTAENAEKFMEIELWIKCVILPIIVIALSVFANVKKYQELNDCLDRSKVVNVMSYFPMANYLCGLLVFVIHTLIYSNSLLGFNAWAVIVILLVLYLTFIVVGFHILSNALFRLDVVGTTILDVVVVAIVACFAFITWRVNVDYFQEYAHETAYIGSGDPLLFFIYVVSAITFIVLCIRLVPLFKKDNRSIYVGEGAYERDYERMVKREYDRAYNDIMDDFEIYFKEHFDDAFDPKGHKKEVVEETKEENAVCPKCGAEVVSDNKFCTACGEKLVEDEEVKFTCPKCTAELVAGNKFCTVCGEKIDEAILEKINSKEPTEEVEVQEEVKVEEALVEAPQEVQEEAKVEEASVEEVKTEESSAEAPQEDEEEKGIAPSYLETVEYASNIRSRDMKITSNGEKTVHKFYYRKKLFLISTDNHTEYSLILLCDKYEAFDLQNLYPKSFVKPLTPKGEQWFQAINRGDLPEVFIKKLIEGSVNIVEQREEEIRKKREAAKNDAESEK